jgi:rubredoxin
MNGGTRKEFGVGIDAVRMPLRPPQDRSCAGIASFVVPRRASMFNGARSACRVITRTRDTFGREADPSGRDCGQSTLLFEATAMIRSTHYVIELTGLFSLMTTSEATAKPRTWMCLICGWIYDEAAGLPDEGIAPGTRWDDVPPNWTCPECGARKEDFELVEI